MATGPLSAGAGGSGIADISRDSAGVCAMARLGIDMRGLLSPTPLVASGGRGAGGTDGGREELVRFEREGAGGGASGRG
jgi:hypothetical protein